MSSPFKPLPASIKIGESTIGAGLTTSSKISFSLDVDEHYGLGDQGKPTLVKGNKHVKGSLDKVYIDKTYGELVLGGTPADIIFYPEGTGTGKQTITVKNAILTTWEFKMDEDKIVAEGIDFIGDELQFGTQS
jgi:hypothetical protein